MRSNAVTVKRGFLCSILIACCAAIVTDPAVSTEYSSSFADPDEYGGPDWMNGTAAGELDEEDIYEDNCSETQMRCKYSYGLSQCIEKCDCHHDCHDISDETNCTNTGNLDFPQAVACDDGGGGVFLGAYCSTKPDATELGDLVRFCDGDESCADGSDEPQDVFGLKCRVNPTHYRPEVRQRWCTIPQKFIERWKGLVQTDEYMLHTICPEDAEVCYKNGSKHLDISKCFQCLDGTVIRMAQVCDGRVDCEDLSDECLCTGSNRTSDIKEFCDSQRSECQCNGDIVCRNPLTKQCSCVEREQLCENSQHCPQNIFPEIENDTTRNYPCISDTGVSISASPCDGRPECPNFEDECLNNCGEKTQWFCNLTFRPQTQELVGCDVINPALNTANHRRFICNGVQDCKNGMDEQYCPRRVTCHPDHPWRNESYDDAEKCDFIMDCETGEDEKHCPGRFYCNDLKPPGLDRSRISDGKIDCPGGEDECEQENANNFANGQYMIKNAFILAFMWLMATVAIVGNSVVIFNCAKDLHETYRRGATGRVGVCNKTLVLNLALADFLMGIYLLILGIKAVQYNDTYCKYWQEWRSSSLCSGLGSLAMLSSQTSVLIMVMMTTYRLYSVQNPFHVEILKTRYLVAVMIACWVPSALVAFLPLRGHDKAFAFLSSEKLPYFDSAVIEKPTFKKFVENAWTMSNFSMAEFGNTEWSDLISKFCKLFPKVCESYQDNQVVEKWYGYYSADSVCLPRLFPHVNDSGWEFTAGVIAFDFVAFVYILLAYTMMYITTVKRSNEPRNGTMSSVYSVDELRSREDRVIWQRISRLLFTDFICWMPICVTCMISLSNHDIPPVMYQISAAFFLPINSALNPLLYSNAMYKAFDKIIPDWLRCDTMPYSGFCSRHRANGINTPSTNSRVNGAVASATDDMRVSRDQLGPETRSSTSSDAERARNASSPPEFRPLVTNGHYRTGSDANRFHTEPPPVAMRPELRNSIARSMAKMTRLFSDRKNTDYQLDERATLPRRQRPKSQSTTSTSTTFTTIGQDGQP